MGSSDRFMCAQEWNCWLSATRATKVAMPMSKGPGVQGVSASQRQLKGTVGMKTCTGTDATKKGISRVHFSSEIAKGDTGQMECMVRICVRCRQCSLAQVEWHA